MGKTGGGRGTNQYQVTGKSVAGQPRPTRRQASLPARPDRRAEDEAHNFPWRPPTIRPETLMIPTPRMVDPSRARARLQARLPDFVFHNAAMEGNTYTLPEVRTLIDGVGVPGHTVRETEQVLALTQAHQIVLDLAGEHPQPISRTVSGHLNAAAAQFEAVEPGMMRGEGHAGPSRAYVAVHDGTWVGPDPGPGGGFLIDLFERGRAKIEQIADPLTRACLWAALATYNQFYWDGNKRTARLMMNAVLVSNGIDAIFPSASDRTAYNRALSDMFQTSDLNVYAQYLLNQFDDASQNALARPCC